MEHQKILFADLYRLMGCIKGELKDTGKDVDKLLDGGDWEGITVLVSGIISEAKLIGAMANAMIAASDTFLQCGPYDGQTAELLPLESMAMREVR